MRLANAVPAALLLLSGCGPSPAPVTGSEDGQASVISERSATTSEPRTAEAAPASTAPRRATSSSPQVVQSQPKGSCAAEIGSAAADKLAATCRQMSPATRPPCNVANSCEMIRDEIARGKAFISRTDIGQTQTDTSSDQSAKAAIDVVRRYYAAIDRRDFADAYRLWGNDGQASGKSRTAFSRGFSHTSSAQVSIGDVGEPRGAAGSVYLTVPVTVTSQLEDGTRQRFTGNYVVRRSSVPSAPAADRRWHIDSADLKEMDVS